MQITIEKGGNNGKTDKETPILFGEDARRFEARMKNPPKETPEKLEEIKRDYKYIMSIFKEETDGRNK